jgi:hypothetical protein
VLEIRAAGLALLFDQIQNLFKFKFHSQFKILFMFQKNHIFFQILFFVQIRILFKYCSYSNFVHIVNLFKLKIC